MTALIFSFGIIEWAKINLLPVKQWQKKALQYCRAYMLIVLFLESITNTESAPAAIKPIITSKLKGRLPIQ